MSFSICFHTTVLALAFTTSALTLSLADTKLPRKTPFIESIEGAKTVFLTNGKKKREVPAGSTVEFGEKLKTDENSSATVIYPDGSKIIISTNSEFRIEAQTGETQWNRLYDGSVRGIIKKPEIPISTKPKFMIRTKAAVLGVRGTDFVMSMNAGSELAQVHTLEGAVEVAQNEVSLLAGKGTMVNEGKFIEGSKTGLSAPQSFDKSEFLKSFDSGHSSTSPTDAGSPTSGTTAPLEAPVSTPTISVEPPSSIAAPTKFPTPPLPNNPGDDPKQALKNNKKSDDSQSFKPLAFQAAIFFTQLPDSTTVRALSVAWTPIIPLPILSFLSLRGHIGGDFAQQGSLNNNFLIYDFQIYLLFTLFNPLYIEGGVGEQIWKAPRLYDAGLATVNAGILVKFWLIDRIFVGYQALNTQPSLNEYKAGIGITF